MEAEKDFQCPSCGGHVFNADRKPQSYQDFIGAPCIGCGHKLTEGDLKRQVGDFAAGAIKSALKDTLKGFKGINIKLG